MIAEWPMGFVLFSHSYVRDLRNYSNWDQEIQLAGGETAAIQFEFKSYGKDFGCFIEQLHEVAKTGEVYLDIIIGVLGGNTITTSLNNTQLKEQATVL